MDYNMIAFTVHGDPVAQGRPRFTTVRGRAKAYDPKKSSDFKNDIKLVARQYAPPTLLAEPLRLEITFYRPMLKSFSKKKLADAERGIVLPTTKPDLDNYLKAVKDALTGVIWRDDSYVTDVFMSKRYSKKPRIEIAIEKAL